MKRIGIALALGAALLLPLAACAREDAQVGGKRS